MKCPRCGGNMSSGVCDECGFPVTRRGKNKFRIITYQKVRKQFR